MGILDRVLGRQQSEERTIGGRWFTGETGQTAGVSVNQDNATSIGAVYAAVKLYADTVAALPWDTYIRIDGTRRPYRPRPNSRPACVFLLDCQSARLLRSENCLAYPPA